MRKYISEKKTWVKLNGWKGYEKPVNAVGGCNHTGSLSDSPCPTKVVKEEIGAFRAMLRKERIKSKLLACRTTNVFCEHIYILVHPENRERALEIAIAHQNQTRLFYHC